MNKTTFKAAEVIRSFYNLLDVGAEVDRQTQRKYAEINRDTDHSEAWKNRERQLVRDKADEEFRTLAKSADELVNSLKQVRNDARAAFRFDDPGFQAALNTINIAGKACPYAVQQQIIDSFRANPTALQALKPMYEARSWSVEKIDEYTRPFTLEENSLFDPMYTLCAYATAGGSKISSAAGIHTPSTWRPEGVARVLELFESALAIDRHENPCVTAIKEIRDGLDEGNEMRGRIDRFLRYNEDRLNEDDPAAIADAKKKIAGNFRPAEDYKPSKP